MSWGMLLRPEVLVLLIPIVGIVMWGLVQISRMVILHRERIAWIEQGLDPDAPHGPLSDPGFGEEDPSAEGRYASRGRNPEGRP